MNASSPDFLYGADITQVTETILWLLKDVDNDIAAEAMQRVINEKDLKGSVFSREDISDSIKEICTNKNHIVFMENEDIGLDKITDMIINSDWWQENSLGVESSFSLYKHVEKIVDSISK